MIRSNAYILAAALAVAVGIPQAASAASSATAKGKAPITIFAGPNLAGPQAGESKQADALAFFPSEVTIPVGQSLTWQFRGFHTVTFPAATPSPPFIVPQPAVREPPLYDPGGSPLRRVRRCP